MWAVSVAYACWRDMIGRLARAKAGEEPLRPEDWRPLLRSISRAVPLFAEADPEGTRFPWRRVAAYAGGRFWFVEP